MAKVKKMSAKEFRQLGYLQELNRQFLHPLGLALEINREKDGTETFGEVWDYRDDPEGMLFGPDMIDADNAARIEEETARKKTSRIHLLGYAIQPY